MREKGSLPVERERVSACLNRTGRVSTQHKRNIDPAHPQGSQGPACEGPPAHPWRPSRVSKGSRPVEGAPILTSRTLWVRPRVSPRPRPRVSPRPRPRAALAVPAWIATLIRVNQTPPPPLYPPGSLCAVRYCLDRDRGPGPAQRGRRAHDSRPGPARPGPACAALADTRLRRGQRCREATGRACEVGEVLPREA